MNTLHLLNKAINFAAEVHRDAKRKGTDIPYITHTLAVALILSRVTNSENIQIAGILHDTIEDCEPYGSITKGMIEKEFNTEIARIVDDLTEQDKTLPWAERKMAAFNHIKEMSHDSLLVKSADVLHNLSSLNDDLENDSLFAKATRDEAQDKVFSKFNAPKANTIERYQRLIPEIKKAWKENPLIGVLEEELRLLLRYA